MGIIKAQKEHNEKVREAMASNVADNLLETLAPADGKVHVAVFGCFGSLGTVSVIAPDEKFNQQADLIISQMQDAGRDIVDVKFDCEYGIGMTKTGIAYRVMVMYK